MPSKRTLISLLSEVCAELGVEMDTHSSDWIVRMRAGGATRWVFGYDFDLNSACAMRLAGDKAAAAMALELAGLPHVPHRLFFSHALAEYWPEGGVWTEISDYARTCGWDVVCKPNDGTGGTGVVRTRTQAELEQAVFTLFQRNKTIAISPWQPCVNEFRVVVLEGRPLVAYRKVRVGLKGDGVSSRLQLLAEYGAGSAAVDTRKLLREAAKEQVDMSVVPAAGEVWQVTWKHNLGRGGGAEVVGENDRQRASLVDLAVRAAAALNLAFCSADILEDERGGLRILEMNSGVMMESFAAQSSDGMEIARGIYREAVRAMFRV